jgi:death-on-curing protein
MRYLTVAEVLEINAELAGGRDTLSDLGLLESAMARPQVSAFGADAYPDIVSKAAALLHSLVLNHPFSDGNKRTGVLAMLVFIDLNGYRLPLSRRLPPDTPTQSTPACGRVFPTVRTYPEPHVLTRVLRGCIQSSRTTPSPSCPAGRANPRS